MPGNPVSDQAYKGYSRLYLKALYWDVLQGSIHKALSPWVDLKDQPDYYLRIDWVQDQLTDN